MKYFLLSLIVICSLSLKAALTVTLTDVVICNGASVTLSPTITGGVGPYSYEWTGGNITGSTRATETDNPTGTTEYKVVVTDDGNGDKDSAIAAILTNPLPTITTSNDDTICPGESTTIHASGGGNYQWSPSTGLDNLVKF